MDNATQPATLSCSLNSRHALEPLIGSASRTDYWILLEYPHPISAKALPESQLPDEIKRHLETVQSSLANARILLIRRLNSSTLPHPVLFLADGRDGHALLHRFPLTGYSDLLKLDIPAILTGSLAAPDFVWHERLILVCTNGKRDPCCAQWGLPVYNALDNQYGGLVWQTSHVGGHRFAPNMVCLPHGLFFSRFPVEGAARIVERYLKGLVSLDSYRGCAAYPAPVQAAEYFLMLENNGQHIGRYALEEYFSTAQNQWQVIFSDTEKPATYYIEIEAHLTGAEIFESCKKPSETKPVTEYRLLQPIEMG